MKTQDEDGYWKDLAERLQAKVAMAESVLERSTKEVERLRAELKREQERADMLHSQVLKFEKRIETGGWS